MDGKTHVSLSMRETYVFQNACITYVKKRTLNAWCSIYAFNIRFLTYVLCMFTYGKLMLHFLLCSLRRRKVKMCVPCYFSGITK